MRTAEASIEVARPLFNPTVERSPGNFAAQLVYIDWCTHPTSLTIHQSAQRDKSIQFNLSLIEASRPSIFD